AVQGGPVQRADTSAHEIHNADHGAVEERQPTAIGVEPHSRSSAQALPFPARRQIIDVDETIIPTRSEPPSVGAEVQTDPLPSRMTQAEHYPTTGDVPDHGTRVVRRAIDGREKATGRVEAKDAPYRHAETREAGDLAVVREAMHGGVAPRIAA